MAQIVPVPTMPINGTSEVQRVAKSGTVTAGRAKLKYKNRATDWIVWNATATVMRDALRALNEIGNTGVNAAGGPINTTPVDLTFAGRIAAADVAQLEVVSNELVGGVWLVTTTTPGATGTLRGYPTGTVVVTQDTGVLYANMGSDTAPIWKRVPAGASAALVDLIHAFGTANGTLDDVGGAFSQATLNNNFKEVSVRLNELSAVLRTAGLIP